MTGLKSGSGDDLWGDDGGDDAGTEADAAEQADAEDATAAEAEAVAPSTEPASESTDGSDAGSTDDLGSTDGTETDGDVTAGASADSAAGSHSAADSSADDIGSDDGSGSAAESPSESTDQGNPGFDLGDPSPAGADDGQSYIVRRAVRDKSVQFERDERLTFFVHDDVAEGERDLITELQSALGRDVPKFDVREAVYRAALRNPDDVLDELLRMGYSLDDE